MIPNAAASVFLVLVLAKFLVVGVSGFSSPWLFWQDALVALGFGALEIAARGRRWIWAPYGLAVAWVAINVPVALVLRSWLTWPMLRAASGPLADSIRYYLTTPNLVPLAAVVCFGVAMPFAVRQRRVAAGLAAVIVIAAGAATTTAKDTSGFERNALTALFPVSGFTGAGTGSDAALRGILRASVVEHSPGRPNLDALRGSARGMNVVMVILESTAAQYLGAYGAAADPMPNLTALSRRSVVFDAAYAVYPESVKGLYATLCSRAPRAGAPLQESLEDSCASLPAAMGRAGYRTGLFHSGRFGYLGMDQLVKQSGFDVAEDAGAIGGVVRSSFGVDEASTVARMQAWIHDDSDARPFFLVYMPAAGHHPYASALPGPFPTETEFDRYRNALHEADAALGTLLASLTPLTSVLVFADHGEAFGQHDGNAGHTLSIWEENVRVPMMLSIPGVTSAERRVADPASVLDVAPTILDLVGAPAPDGLEGGSLLAPAARIAPFFADYSVEWFGLRDGCWKAQYERRSGRSALFNVCEDPAEASDVSRRFQPLHDELVKRVKQFFAI